MIQQQSQIEEQKQIEKENIEFIEERCSEFKEIMPNYYIPDYKDLEVTDEENKEQQIKEKKTELKESFLKELEQMDAKFHSRYKTVQIKAQTEQFYKENQNIEIPESQNENDKFMKKTFVADAGYISKYENLHRMMQSRGEEGLGLEIDGQQDKIRKQKQQQQQKSQEIPIQQHLNEQFTNIQYNFQDVQANSRFYQQNSDPSQRQQILGTQSNLNNNNIINQQQKQSQINSTAYNFNNNTNVQQQQYKCQCSVSNYCKYHEGQTFYQNQLNDEEKYQYKIQNLKANIEQLGGIDDQVKQMTGTLRQFEARKNQYDYQQLESQKILSNQQQRQNNNNIQQGNPFQMFKSKRESIANQFK